MYIYIYMYIYVYEYIRFGFFCLMAYQTFLPYLMPKLSFKKKSSDAI